MNLNNASLDTQLSVQDDYLCLKVKVTKSPKINLNIHVHSFKLFSVEKLIMKAGQKVKISINPTDAYGNAARLDGMPVWSVSDDSLGALDVSSDGTVVEFSSIGKVGQVIVEVAADADLSEGIRNIAGSLTLDIEPGEAVDLGVYAEPIVMTVEPVAPVTEEAVVDAPVVEETPVEVAPADEFVPVEETSPEAPMTEETSAAPVTEEAPVETAPVTEEAPVAPVTSDGEPMTEDTSAEAPVVDDTTQNPV